ncbi:hypothetical protein HDK90DRAFT_545355 [Phyllosticta capitalensis]|uniref:Rhodopsin domain-containing protein n=1 Tax=Phyllosticta capitalensis TaxID=121624 RepID=A0ABR1Y955_9PEZI
METAVVVEISVAFLIGTITTIWRSVVAAKSPKGLLADDRLAIFACVVWWASSGIFAFGGYEFPITNANVSDDEREHPRPGGDRPDFAKNVMIGSFIIFVGLECGILFIWTLKLSVLFYFARLMGHVDTMRRHLEVATILWASTFMTMVLYQHFRCVPIERNWQIYPDPGNACKPAAAIVNQYVSIVSDGFMDLVFIIMALDFVRRASPSMKPKHRALLSSIFSLGIIVVVLEAMVLYRISTNQTMTTMSASMWRFRKSYVMVIVANIPSLYPTILDLCRRGRDKIVALKPKTSDAATSVPAQVETDVEQGIPLQPAESKKSGKPWSNTDSHSGKGSSAPNDSDLSLAQEHLPRHALELP